MLSPIIEALAESEGRAAWQMAKRQKPAEWYFARIVPIAVPKHFTFTTEIDGRRIVVKFELADPHARGLEFAFDLDLEEHFNGDLFEHEINRAAYIIAREMGIHCRFALRTNQETVEEMARGR